MSWSARHISRYIARPPNEVSAYLADHANLPKWAAGLSAGGHEENGAWISESPMGKVQVRFAPANELGVFDHDVTLPDGKVVHNPLRVLTNDQGSEVLFTLYRHEGVTQVAFEKDATTIAGDLERLRDLLEK